MYGEITPMPTVPAKKKQILEISIVFIMMLALIVFAPFFVSLSGSVPIKMVALVLVNCLLVGIALVPYIIKKEPILSGVGFTKTNTGKQVAIGLVLFLLQAVFLIILPLLLGVPKEYMLWYKQESVGILVFYIFFYMTCIGVGEEIIYRGYLFESLKKVTKRGASAVIISSFLFGLSHFPSSGSILIILTTGGIGMIYGFCRLKIKDCSTLSVGIAHGLNNTFILILSYVLL